MMHGHDFRSKWVGVHELKAAGRGRCQSLKKVDERIRSPWKKEGGGFGQHWEQTGRQVKTWKIFSHYYLPTHHSSSTWSVSQPAAIIATIFNSIISHHVRGPFWSATLSNLIFCTYKYTSPYVTLAGSS